MSRTRIFLWFGCVCVVAFLFWYFFQTPSNERDWSADQEALSSIRFAGDTVYINDIRNYTYTSTSDYKPSYYNKEINLNSVQSVDFIVEPFESIGGAHTFLSFGFDDGSYIAISIEIRKEVGESFSPWKGILRQYELMYVIADERDVIDLRANHRKDDVYLYPTLTDRDDARALFVDMLTRAEKLREVPEFYNTLTSNCTTNIVGHINTLRDTPLSWDYRMLFPEDSDVLAKELGFILPDMTIEEARPKYRINKKAEEFKDDPLFSQRIRE